MTTANDSPRIYVACLACYNEGKLHGVWIDANQDASDIDQERAAMQEECGHTDNDWAIHDTEGFGEYRVGEFTGFTEVAQVAEGIEEHDGAWLAWLSNGNDPDSKERFEEAYRGEFGSVEAYAEQLVDDLGMLQGVSDLVSRYFDYESFARDLELGGDIWTAEAPSGVYVFDACV